MRLWLKRSRNRRNALCALIVLGSLFVGGPAGAQQSINAETYINRLEQAETIANDAAQDPSLEGLESIKARLALPVSFTIGDTHILVDEIPFLDRMEISEEGFAQAAAHLDELALETERALAAEAPSSVEIGRALPAAYGGIDLEPPNAWERFRERIVRALVRVADFIFGVIDGVTTGKVLPIAALVVFVIVVALIIWRISARLDLVSEAAQPTEREPAPTQLDLLREAERALQAGDLDAAIHHLYGALLQALAARALILDDPSLTAGEVRRAVQDSRSSLYPTVDKASSIFEMVAYGHAAPTQLDIDALRKAHEEAAA